MAVVSDSSPLILYSAIQRLDLLHAVFDSDAAFDMVAAFARGA